MNFDAANEFPFYVGNLPWLNDICSLHAYIDELSIFSRETKSYEIQAEVSSNFLGGIEPNYIHLGCVGCTLQEAKSSCIEDYHLCTILEMSAGVYSAAKAMGWVTDQALS